MSAADAFFDSNVLLYLTASDSAKADRAETLIAAGGVVSVQVLNEMASVARRKFQMEWFEIREMLLAIRSACEVEAVSVETHELGIDIAQRYGFQVRGSMIVAASLRAGCTTLYSEDLQDGQRIERLTIRNPFSGPEFASNPSRRTPPR